MFSDMLISRTGRVRKKSSKVREMEEGEEDLEEAMKPITQRVSMMIII